jgi:hypothetical protein
MPRLNSDRLVSRSLYASIITLLIHVYVLWSFLDRGTSAQTIILAEGIGVAAGLLVGWYWIRSVRMKLLNNTLYYSKRLNIILSGAAIILILIQAPGLFASQVPNHVMPYLALPLTISITLGVFGVALWAIRYERRYGPLYVEPKA